MSEDIDALKGRLDLLNTQREIATAQLDLKELTELAARGSVVMEASWGDFIDPLEYVNDDPTFGRPGYLYSQRDDRSDGKFRPVFETETDLALIRGKTHVITTGFDAAINILENLTNYTINTGFDFKVNAACDDAPQGLVQCAQAVLDTFFDDNDWKSDLERELHWRTREDGEAPLVLRPRGWRTVASFVEPDQITQPASPIDLENWLAAVGGRTGSEVASDFVASWSFGVHSPSRDCSRHLGYHCVFDGAGNDWEYFPAGDVPLALAIGSGVLEMVKRNVPRRVKRGIPDFYPVIARLERSEKLARNVEETSAIQAAIAFIREHVQQTTQTQIDNLRTNLATSNYQKPLPGGSTRTTYRQRMAPGSIIDTNGTKFLYGPMGQNNAPTYIDVIQATLRRAGARWAMPEYMISGDASNANFSSTLVAGSPFVTAREADQKFYGSRFHRIAWIVLRIAYEGGRFSRFGLTWAQIEALLDVLVTPPDITISDDLKVAQVKEIERRNGVLSAETWMKETGRDADTEQENLAKERVAGIVPPQPAYGKATMETALQMTDAERQQLAARILWENYP
jgi:hypothetical protein